MHLSAHSSQVKNRLKLFSFAAALYQASRMFCSAIGQLYLLSLGFNSKDLLYLHAFHSLAFGLLNLPVAFYADAVSRKKVVFSGLTCVALYLLIYALLAPLCGSSYTEYGWYLILLAEMFYGLGRQSVSLALNGWVVNQIPAQERSQLFPYFAHTTQSYNTLFSILSGSLGILMAYWHGYPLSYGFAFFSLLATLGVFGYLASTEKPMALHEGEAQHSSQKPSSVPIFLSLWQGAQRIANQGRKAVKTIFSSAAYGGVVLLGTVLVALARWITYHYWQPLMFGDFIKLNDKLPMKLMLQLQLCNLGMYFGQFLTNRYLKSVEPMGQVYYRRLHQLLALGAGAAAYLALAGSSSLLNSSSTLAPCVFIVLAFSSLQGAVGSLQVVQDNLYVRNLKPEVISSCVSILQFGGRAVVSFGSFLVGSYGERSKNNPWLFAIPAFALLTFQLLIEVCGLRASKRSKISKTDPL